MSEGDEQDDSQRTEDPTPKKLEEARKRGQVPMSKEVNTWFLMLIGTIVIVAMGPGMMRDLTVIMRDFLDHFGELPGLTGLGKILWRLFSEVLGILFPPMAILVIAAAAAPFAQVGPLYSIESIKPKLDKLSPVAGFDRLFSKRSLFEFIKGLIKVAIIGFVSYKVLQPYFVHLDQIVVMPVPELLKEMLAIFSRLMTAILTVLLLLAGGDLVFQRYTHMQQMRMSRQEIKDEYKQTEGDPHIKSKLRQLRMEKSRKRMMQNVPDSTVVVTNPTHFAVALKYDPEAMDAPICVAKGQDLVALRIRQIAEENDVVIVENPPLARTLFKAIEIDEAIPPEHYKAVAEVISYVFRLKKKL
ncbi:MAG: flagellar biosynthesis protein FlhB [Alphaproteobacteria bacterium]|nr:flagellar biosynthesis protein FlhB [Alphaproteobacteria bacterium]USO08080.1 MAG: flagellar biosynthesis protein FlhB [Rhodospirillales bacterium]